MLRAARLLEQLHAYEPVDSLEAGHRVAMVHLLSSSPDAFSRAQFTPGHFTASCFIVDDGGRLLLHHHRRLERWLQMGGHVEAGETPDAAALREGTEESGLGDLVLMDGAILDLDIHAIPAAKSEPEHDHFDVRYLAHTSRPDSITIDRDESKDLAWVALDRAALLMPGLESQRVLRKIESLMRTGGRASRPPAPGILPHGRISR